MSSGVTIGYAAVGGDAEERLVERSSRCEVSVVWSGVGEMKAGAVVVMRTLQSRLARVSCYCWYV